ncbi:DUF6588 family protein [Fontimonas sp. SYSU GA230001]|uniref:DUF6588 family protein n=1 Tax=Fontimonas sp. SYSU GA230001 TaxID=3142450 RepID=UPI0032B61756
MRRVLLLCSFVLPAAPALAATEFGVDCVSAGNTCQVAFEGVVKDVAAALNYKQLGPAEATGITGIGLGVFANYTTTENRDAWRTLTGTDVDAVGMAGIVASKGLPFGIDVGAFFTAVPDTSVKVYGAELRYAILEGGVAQPALAVRGAYTRTDGIDDFDYEAWNADVSLSKGFAILTPYIGAGYVWATATPKGSAAQLANLREVEADRERFFAGLRLGLGLLELTPEYERIGDNNAYNLRFGLSF